MLGTETITKIKELKNSGCSHVEIGRLLNISYPTVIKYSREDSDFNKSLKASTEYVPKRLSIFESKINQYIKADVTSSKKIELLLRNEGYTGSYQLLNNYVKSKRENILLGKVNSYYRVETLPGEQAQVDWGSFGKIDINGMKVNLYVFVLVLSHSRALYAEFVTSQRQKTLQDCHMRAFKYLGGIPKKIRYDNMKTVVISRVNTDAGERINWNFEFQNFAHYYKFEVEACPPYYPRSKGKVEAAVKFIRYNFFDGELFNKTFFDVNELNEKLQKWLDGYANQRKHPTLEGSVLDFWQNERKELVPVQIHSDFSNVSPQIRRVSRISMVSYKKAFYWVPKKYIQHKVEVREIPTNGKVILEFYSKDGKVYEHIMAPPGSWILPDDRELIKVKGKQEEVVDRLQRNPTYNTQVELRDLNYYSKIIKNHNG